MSRDTVVAKRYARALYEVAQENGIVSEVLEQLGFVAQSLQLDAEVRGFFTNPSIDSSVKIELIRKVYADRVSALLLNLLEMVVERGRHNLIDDLYDAYANIANNALGQAKATVYTAKLLTADELAKVEQQFGALVGKKIVAEQIVEPALLGGVQVRIGDRLYDGSLSGKLARLEQSLKTQAM